MRLAPNQPYLINCRRCYARYDVFVRSSGLCRPHARFVCGGRWVGGWWLLARPWQRLVGFPGMLKKDTDGEEYKHRGSETQERHRNQQLFSQNAFWVLLRFLLGRALYNQKDLRYIVGHWNKFGIVFQCALVLKNTARGDRLRNGFTKPLHQQIRGIKRKRETSSGQPASLPIQEPGGQTASQAAKPAASQASQHLASQPAKPAVTQPANHSSQQPPSRPSDHIVKKGSQNTLPKLLGFGRKVSRIGG